VRVSKGKSMKMLADFWRQNPSRPLILNIGRALGAVLVVVVGLTGFLVLNGLPGTGFSAFSVLGPFRPL
jgi:uncharacterized membrane protein